MQTLDFKNPRFEKAHAVIQDAGALALTYFHNVRSLKIEQKTDEQDLVSIADKSLEKLIRDSVLQSFPDDGFLGEEDGLKEGRSGYIWVVDPIDGTSPFLRGMHEWSISVALVKDGILDLGLIYIPCQKELFYAVQGQGAFLNGERISVDCERTLRNGTIGIGLNPHVSYEVIPHFLHHLMEKGAQFFRCGSAAISLSYVSCGRLVGYYQPLVNSWDCMAGLCLIREAGGWVEGFSSKDALTQPMPIAAGGSQIKDDLLALIHATRRDSKLPVFEITTKS